MNIDLQKIIKELSEVYDSQSRDVFVSVYLNRETDQHFLKRRIQSCETLLKGEEKQNFSQTMEKITDYLGNHSEKNIALFSSNIHNFMQVVPLPVAVNNTLIVDSSPYIRPLARILDEWEPFLLVLMNSNQAKIFSIELGVAEQEKSLSSHIMSKHKKGGWSQARFQRIRKGAIHEFFTEVSEYLQKEADQQIVLAGPGTAKTQFMEMLPDHIRKKIVKIIDVDIDDEQEIIKQSLSVVSVKEDKKGHEVVTQLKAEILKDGLGVYGFDETLKAARNGQIDVLIVEKDYHLKGCLCEHCQILKAGPIKDCPVCGNSTTEADIIEEIIEFAERTDASIEFTDDEEIGNLGHIGGLLRYKM